MEERFQDASETLRSSIDQLARKQVTDWQPPRDATTASPSEIADLALATLQRSYRDNVFADFTDGEEDEAAKRAKAWDLWGNYLTEDTTEA